MKPLLALLLLVCYVWLSPSGSGREAVRPSVGQDNVKEVSPQLAPAFTLPDLNGQQISSADLKGSVVVLDFWGTWCEPCIAEIPTFNKLQEKYGSRGLRVIGIAVQSGWAQDIKPYVERYKIKYQILVGNDDVVERYGVFAFPTVYLIDKDVRVYKRFVGTTPGKEAEKASELEHEIEKLIVEKRRDQL